MANECLQLFCNLRLAPWQHIRDTGIVSRIRGYLARHADLIQVQLILAQHWKREINFQQVLKMDAVCYESYIRYPTDVKLLWECCEWVYKKQLFPLRRELKIRVGKEKERFDTQHKKYVDYAKLKKKTHKKTRKRIKSLLNLLKRGIDALQALLDTGQLVSELKKCFYRAANRQYLRTVKQVFLQQHHLYHNPGSQIKDRIVSLHKPYIRPIKRGKENKPTEFGAKIHMMQVDGLNLIEHLDFKAFNECKRLKVSVVKHKMIFGQCRQLSADGIYATNENRRFCSQQTIFTNFDPKGRPLKDRQQLKQQQRLKEALNQERATRLEG